MVFVKIHLWDIYLFDRNFIYLFRDGPAEQETHGYTPNGGTRESVY